MGLITHEPPPEKGSEFRSVIGLQLHYMQEAGILTQLTKHFDSLSAPTEVGQCRKRRCRQLVITFRQFKPILIALGIGAAAGLMAFVVELLRFNRGAICARVRRCSNNAKIYVTALFCSVNTHWARWKVLLIRLTQSQYFYRYK